MKYIKLVYWDGIQNLGDLLSPYIVGKLSGLPIKSKKLYLSGKKKQLTLFLDLLCGRITKRDFSKTLFFFEKNILAIGSIIALGNKKSIIWGSGFMNQHETFRGGKVYAVRGKLTNEKLKKIGFEGCEIFGDPALLIPLILPPSYEKKYEVAIIPHWREVDYFKSKYSNQYKILDIRTDNVKEFIDELTSCRYVLSTSLHGIILSHAYNIPALWIKEGYIDTDGFKFYDYFSSVEIPFYDGISDFDSYLLNNTWKSIFDKYKINSLPLKSIRVIQKNLITVAPFKVLDKYKI